MGSLQARHEEASSRLAARPVMVSTLHRAPWHLNWVWVICQKYKKTEIVCQLTDAFTHRNIQFSCGMYVVPKKSKYIYFLGKSSLEIVLLIRMAVGLSWTFFSGDSFLLIDIIFYSIIYMCRQYICRLSWSKVFPNIIINNIASTPRSIITHRVAPYVADKSCKRVL